MLIMPGSIEQRKSKDSLCYSCENEIKIGRVKSIESTIQYDLVFQHSHAYADDGMNTNVHNILKAIDNPEAETKGVIYLRQSFGSNGKYYKIDNRLIEPLGNLFSYLDSCFLKIKEQKDRIPEEARIAVKTEKDTIFNDGIKFGRNLLVQLNTGDVSISDFEKNYSYVVNSSNSNKK